jgi:membrane-anchored mycosin MYCP
MAAGRSMGRPRAGRTARSLRAALAAAASILLVAAPGVSFGGAPGSTASAADCAIAPGQPEAGTPWARTRLDYEQVWAVTRGAGVTVAVIDSGLYTAGQPQLTGMRVTAGQNVQDGANPADTVDCHGHGTAVSSIIAAQPLAGAAFTGVAPDATIMPIKQSSTDTDGTAAGVARGITAAIARGARIINISLGVVVDDPGLRAAVAAAEKANVLIVAASSNQGQNGNPISYPAAYPTVLAVGASASDDSIAPYSSYGTYVDIAAPGDKVEVAAALGGYLNVSGTSFAAPYASGVAALVRAAHPELTAAQVRHRLIASADPPGVAVPDTHYGYGIVNPVLAVTAVGIDAAGPSSGATLPTIAQPALPNPPDRTAQNRALAIGASLVGLALLLAITAAVTRPRRRSASVS